MDTTTAQLQQDSYADAYVPPAQAPQQPVDPVMPDPGMQDPMSAAPVMSNDPVPPALEPTPVQEPQAPEAAQAEAPSESLADQNIFEMLGVTTGTPEQREQFLDELQQVIWDDFLEHDVKLLLTEQEQADLDQILGGSPNSTLEQQEKVVVFLEKLIPDLEDIMLEKALQLKAEMARERLSALKELHRNDPEKMAIITTAEQQMSQDQWRSATVSLSTLG